MGLIYIAAKSLTLSGDKLAPIWRCEVAANWFAAWTDFTAMENPPNLQVYSLQI